MYRKFIATIAAASIALTALGAAPALAGDRDTAKAVAAILGLAVVGKLIHDRNDRKKERRKQQSYYAPVHKEPKYKPQHGHTPKYRPPVYHQPKPRPLPQAVNRKLLPQQCFRTYETRRGRVAMFANRCLQRNFAFADRLPRQCEYIFNTPNGERRGYEARCLRDRGYQLARR